MVPQFILSMIKINRKINFLFTVGFPQLSYDKTK